MTRAVFWGEGLIGFTLFFILAKLIGFSLNKEMLRLNYTNLNVVEIKLYPSKCIQTIMSFKS